MLMKLFDYMFIRFSYNEDKNSFDPVRFEFGTQTLKEVKDKYSGKGLTYNERKELLTLYGQCLINVPKRSIISILIFEILNPFYIF